ncbi:hypothetical protein KAFR_0E03570 [Kazachstania africana CBS 2517]|uniref:Mannosyltransferase n=1 Tax=Kazachstania africana (strain ATCC 22294 / BCRC 22015 / CBS 2517 / CECT 1963 / NBRC 1671 / NRRL Y-8276) TaxID=1071382 RepID=H2AVV8_KAZAF|nr:hypothetical protein KAFR_0E03570 [Kazachstania africana CBS 2517]CCF58508.1 hypothetical protein KAFR_0E03570 [Kazachstania africana CBS 2517]
MRRRVTLGSHLERYNRRLVMVGMKHIGYCIGAVVAMQMAYIHPDEHFQSLEIMMKKFMDVSGTTAWEFDNMNAARSYAPLLLFYGPIFFIMSQMFHLESPLLVLYLVRLQQYLVYIAVMKLSLKILLPSKRQRRRADFLISTSYITWCFQSHTFSNSNETLLLLLVLSIFHLQIVNDNSTHSTLSIASGFLITVGIFNRITFPGFILLPSFLVFFKFYVKHWKSLLLLMISIACSCYVCALIDTRFYHSSTLLLAPLNNLKYNLNVNNLAEHGLHPRYLHLSVNLPQILLSGLLYIIPRDTETAAQQIKTLPFLSIISSLIVLSSFQHQESRFLVPLLPLFCIIFTTSKYRHSSALLKLWIVSNLIMGIIMGCLHQSGVLNVLQYFHTPQHSTTVDIWWKTYSPPTWMYMKNALTVSTTNFVDDVEKIDLIDFSNTNNHVVDLKGCDFDLLNSTIYGFLEKVNHITLIAPDSIKKHLDPMLGSNLLMEQIYHSSSHLDLDHFDFEDFSSFKLGISVYRISHQK